MLGQCTFYYRFIAKNKLSKYWYYKYIYMLITNNTSIRGSIENLLLLQQILIRQAGLPNSLSFSASQLFRKQAFLQQKPATAF
jgi:hypothetical protein